MGTLARIHRLTSEHARDLLRRAEQAAADDPQARSGREWFTILVEEDARVAVGKRTAEEVATSAAAPPARSGRAPHRSSRPLAPGKQTLVMLEAERAANEAAVPDEHTTPHRPSLEASQREPGRLDVLTQWRMSQAFGFDFNGVSIRRDSPLATGATRALVKDGEVHFRQGEYRPGTRDGDWLIAHELAHVVQQQGGREARAGTRKQLEREADRAATLAILGSTAPIALRAQPATAYAYSDDEEHDDELDDADESGAGEAAEGEVAGAEAAGAKAAGAEAEGADAGAAKADEARAANAESKVDTGRVDDAPASPEGEAEGAPAGAEERPDLDARDDTAGADDAEVSAGSAEDGGGAAGGGAGSSGGTPAKKEKEAPDVTAAKPEAGLSRLVGVRPDKLVSALGQVHAAAAADVGKARAEQRANPPKQLSTGEAAAPRQAGAPGANAEAEDGAAGAKSAVLAKDVAPGADKATAPIKAEVPGGEAAKQAQQGEAAQQQELAGQVVTEAARSIETWFSSWFGSWFGDAKQQGEMSDEEKRQMSGSLDKVSTNASDIATSPGPAPELAMKGEAKASSDAERARLETETARLEQQGHADSRVPLGEDEIETQVPTEALTSKAVSGGAAPEVALPTVEGAAPSEEIGIVAKEQQGAEIDAALAKASTDVTAERAKHANEEEKARADADKQIRDLKTKADADHAAAKTKAKTEVEQARGEWQSEIDKKGADARRQADKRVAAEMAQVEAAETQANAESRTHIEEGQQKAEEAKRKGEKDAADAKAKGKRKSSGFLGWLSRKAKAFVNRIKKAISAAINAARKAVKAVINAAKKLAMAAIEFARKVITAAIKRIGDALIAISDVLLAAFPELKAKFQAGIRKAVRVATDAVNKIAERLKKDVQAALDRLGAALDKVLGLLEKGLHAIVDAVGAVVQGAIAAAQAIVDLLGTWARLIKHIASGPGAWLGKLKAAVVDGIQNHLWTAFKTAVLEWFKSRMFELLGVSGMILQDLLAGGITQDDIIQMAFDALKDAIPGALIAILLKKLVSMIVPAAGALMTIIEGLQAAWGVISRIIAAFSAFMAFLLAVQGGAAGPLFATALASAAIVLLDFVSIWLLKELRGPASRVGARLKGMAAKFKARGKGRPIKPGSKPKSTPDKDGTGEPVAKPNRKRDNDDGLNGKSKKDRENKGQQDRKDKTLVERVARHAAAAGWRQAKVDSGSRVLSHAEVESSVRRAERGSTGVRVDADIVGVGSSWRIKAKATKSSHSATSTTGNGTTLKAKAGSNWYTSKRLGSLHKQILRDTSHQLKQSDSSSSSEGKDLEAVYGAKKSLAQQLEAKGQSKIDGRIHGIKFNITMEPISGVKDDHQIKTKLLISPNYEEMDINVPAAGEEEEFKPIRLKAVMADGHEPVQVRPNAPGADGTAELWIANQKGTKRLGDIENGPISRATNRSGLQATKQVISRVEGIVSEIEAVKVQKGKVPKDKMSMLRTKGEAACKIVSDYGKKLETNSLEGATHVRPISNKQTVTFKKPDPAKWKGPYVNKFIAEMIRQLQQQEAGLNELTLDKWVLNREKFSPTVDLNAMDDSAKQEVLKVLKERCNKGLPAARRRLTGLTAKKAKLDAAVVALQATAGATPAQMAKAMKKAKNAARAHAKTVAEIQGYLDAQAEVTTGQTGGTMDTSKMQEAGGRVDDQKKWAKKHRAAKNAIVKLVQANDPLVAEWSGIVNSVEDLAVLHDPDQIAGGGGDIPDFPVIKEPTDDSDDDGHQAWRQYLAKVKSHFGVRRINNSLGPQWTKSIEKLHAEVTRNPPNPQEAYGIRRLNVELKPGVG